MKIEMEETMKIEIEVPDQDIDDALCSAFEGGITYWARVARYTAFVQYEYVHEIALKEGGSVQLAVTEGSGEDMEVKPLNRETIAAGLKIMAEKHPRHFGDLLGECTQDATTGDVLVQLAVFGELVFG